MNKLYDYRLNNFIVKSWFLPNLIVEELTKNKIIYFNFINHYKTIEIKIWEDENYKFNFFITKLNDINNIFNEKNYIKKFHYLELPIILFYLLFFNNCDEKFIINYMNLIPLHFKILYKNFYIEIFKRIKEKANFYFKLINQINLEKLELILYYNLENKNKLIKFLKNNTFIKPNVNINILNEKE